MNITEINDELFNLQKKVFTRWVNDKLKSINNNQVEDITIDSSNGFILELLAKALTKNDLVIHITDDKQFKHNIKQYIQYAIEIFIKDGIKFDDLSIKDIDENYDKVIQNIIWELISHYSINKSLLSIKQNKDNNKIKTNDINNTNKENLLSWAIDRISNYPHIENFHPYELFICALLDSYVPDKINYYALDPNNSEYNMQLALGVMKCLGIPIYIYHEDISKNENQIDEKALLTQLSSFKIVLDIQESMTQTFSISSSDDDEKTLQNSETSSNTFVEFDYDSFSQSESQDKFASKQQLMTHEPSLLTLSNSDSIYKSLTTALSETQRISQKEIEKLMAKIDLLTEQLYEARGKIGELTKKEKIDQTTIESLKQNLKMVEEQSEIQDKSQRNIDDLSSQVYHLQKELSNSENLSKELQFKLSETESNYFEKIEKLKQKLSTTENLLNEYNLKLSDYESKTNEITIKLASSEKNVTELKQKLADSENNINNLTAKLSVIEKNKEESIKALNQRITNSENKEKELTTIITETEKSKQEIIDKLTQKLTESENHAKELTTKLLNTESNSQESVDELKQKLVESECQINNLTRKLSETENSNQEKLNSLEQKLVESENQVKELTTKLSDSETNNQGSINDLKQKLVESEKQINDLTTKLSEAENSNLETLDSLKQKLIESENHVKELTIKLSEAEQNNEETIECFKKKLAETLDMNKSLIDQLSSQKQEQNSQIEFDHLSCEIDRLNKELAESLSNEKLLKQKFDEAQSNCDFASKQLSEVTINMRKALLDSEMKFQTLSAKAQQEIEELINENNRLKEELQTSKSNEKKLTNELDETKKNSEIEVNHLMVVLSDSEKRCIEFYHKSQEEIDSLTKQLEESKEQTLLAQSDFEQMKQAFSESQARVYQLYEKLYNAK